MNIVAKRQGQKGEYDAADELEPITDDEEFNREFKKIADGNTKNSAKIASQQKTFYDDDSYFSEDEATLQKDAVMAEKYEANQGRFAVGSFLNAPEIKLLNSGFETRERRRADRLDLKTKISSKKPRKGYNAKEIVQRLKDAGVRGNSLEIEALANEMNAIEKEQQLEGLRGDELDARAPSKHNEKDRLFITNFDEGKLYTNKYVRRLKAAHNKLIDKFTLGSKYALTAQRKQIMARATRLVVDSHNKLLETFEKEALSLVYQTQKAQVELSLRNKQVERLVQVNRELELDLSMVLRQNDYVEARIPNNQKCFEGYLRQEMSDSEALDSQQSIKRLGDLKCETLQPSKAFRKWTFDWDKLSVNERVDRAGRRSHIMCKLESMEPTLTKHPFDFYGTYVRISES